MPERRLGLLGGTFDPVHIGHLESACVAQQMLQLERVRFVPAARPPHRPDSPGASGYHRLEMVKLAVADTPGWEVWDLELTREGPSYTYDTLIAAAAEGLTPLQIFFITGADAFAEITTWYRYPEILDLAHFAVVARPGVTLASLRERLPQLAARMCEPADLAHTDRTRIVLLDAPTPDVSGTDIRQRVARGESIDGLVPPAVAAYIYRNQLYRQARGAQLA